MKGLILYLFIISPLSGIAQESKTIELIDQLYAGDNKGSVKKSSAIKKSWDNAFQDRIGPMSVSDNIKLVSTLGVAAVTFPLFNYAWKKELKSRKKVWGLRAFHTLMLANTGFMIGQAATGKEICVFPMVEYGLSAMGLSEGNNLEPGELDNELIVLTLETPVVRNEEGQRVEDEVSFSIQLRTEQNDQVVYKNVGQYFVETSMDDKKRLSKIIIPKSMLNQYLEKTSTNPQQASLHILLTGKHNQNEDKGRILISEIDSIESTPELNFNRTFLYNNQILSLSMKGQIEVLSNADCSTVVDQSQGEKSKVIKKRQTNKAGASKR